MGTPRLLAAKFCALPVALLAGCGGVDSVPNPAEQEAGEEVVIDRYCAYGAESRAQLQGCKDHVSLADISDRDTNAARFALYELNDCLADAGPFCTRAAK